MLSVIATFFEKINNNMGFYNVLSIDLDTSISFVTQLYCLMYKFHVKLDYTNLLLMKH